MKCQQCSREFTPKRKSGQFCSVHCRVKHARKISVSNKPHVSVSGDTRVDTPIRVNDTLKSETATVPRPDDHLTKLSRHELYASIDAWPAQTRFQSSPFLELIRRLNTTSLATLKADGYWIPKWKENGLTYDAALLQLRGAFQKR